MSSKAKLVKPENTLKKKVGTGGFNESDLIKAQHGIENNKIDFRPMGQDLLKELDSALKDIKDGKIATDREKFDLIMYPLMQLKAQGGLFQYALISRISHATLDFLENIPGVDEDVLSITRAYRNTIQAILALEMKGDTNPAGLQLLKELDAAFLRYKNQRLKLT